MRFKFLALFGNRATETRQRLTYWIEGGEWMEEARREGRRV